MENIDECMSHPCQNNGTCTDGDNGYVCECQAGLAGDHCEININECGSSPCMNSGDCIDDINGYHCNCTNTGFEGTECDTNINECESVPCQHGGTCADHVKGYTCTCLPGFTGTYCEVDIPECESTPCQNGGTCEERSLSAASYDDGAGYDCTCLPGFRGIHCEEDIDECLSMPCVHGECMNLINNFQCECEPGYQGVQCSEEIDECEAYQPCQNGAQCTDKLADYKCDCPMDDMNVQQHSGKNCTVELTACLSHQCLNSATCIPFLVDEATNLQNYMCRCEPGFAGTFCEKTTMASFDGSSFLLLSNNNSDSLGSFDLHLSFEFRTTLSSKLMLAHNHQDARSFLLSIQDGEYVTFMYNGATSVTLRVPVTGALSLNDAEWHQVELNISQTKIVVVVHHPQCTESCSVIQPLSTGSAFSIDSLHLGGYEQSIDSSVHSFTGCMRDILMNSITIIPADINTVTEGNSLVEGCPRVQQCLPETCQYHGLCVDFWNTFECQCDRPYFGRTCGESFKAATFGYNDVPSFASFEVPESQREHLASNADISLFFRTRKPSGLIFYLGNDPNVQQMFSYILVELIDGSMRATFHLQGTPNERSSPRVFNFGSDLSSGNQHFLRLHRFQNSMNVFIDGVELAEASDLPDTLLVADVLYVGKFPPVGGARVRRQIGGREAYKGTIRDIRVNGILLHIFPPDDTHVVLPLSINSTDTEHVVEGEVTDDICGEQNPCANGSTCSNVFFNDYNCSCMDGYTGRNCELVDYCFNIQCPGSNSTCNSLADGYECVTPATFNGQSYIQYSHTLPTTFFLNSMSFNFRSRQTGGLIFHIHGTNSIASNFITVALIAGELSVAYDLGTPFELSSRTILSDGLWHSARIVFNANNVELIVNNITMTRSDSTQSVELISLLDGNNDIMVGGYVTANVPDTTMLTTQDFFKGCLDDVRLGEMLLPFFEEFQLASNTASEKFTIVRKMYVEENGCYGDDVCATNDCQHGATCVDIWNDYTCTCVLGFNGTLCENNIDDCVDHACENGATCMDAVNSYTCSCPSGFYGSFCEIEVDECESSPCQNNATCFDLVNSFDCNCTANYTGALCEIMVTDNCDNDPCYNNATCIPVNTTSLISFTCACLPGYTDRLCETPINYCEGDPCINDGTCENNRPMETYVCQCLPGFTGINCETQINECDSQPCQNGANCTDYIGQYTCHCTEGWNGTNCEADVNECNLNPCIHGQCFNTPGSFVCVCGNTGYQGVLCEQDIDECFNNPCQNESPCENSIGSYSCNCSLGYEGNNCQFVNCSHDQCINGGACIVDGNHWICSCPEYFEGSRCEIRGPCVDHPCSPNARCEQDGQQFMCVCSSGWTGDRCDEDIDECLDPNLCQNGGNCSNLDGSYRCNCPPGFMSDHCEVNINECESMPCLNNGQCEDSINSFVCNCTGTGYEGTVCQSDVNECNGIITCQNGGTCTNSLGSFDCACMQGWLGTTCHIINPCNESGVCSDHGDCTWTLQSNDLAKRKCLCSEGYEGPNCETAVEPVTDDPDDNMLPLIIGLVVGCVVLIVIIVVIVLVLMARSKRATRGVYSPSRQEMSGSRLGLGNQLKIPPEERLI